MILMQHFVDSDIKYNKSIGLYLLSHWDLWLFLKLHIWDQLESYYHTKKELLSLRQSKKVTRKSLQKNNSLSKYCKHTCSATTDKHSTTASLTEAFFSLNFSNICTRICKEILIFHNNFNSKLS